jgi:hypothetical protein
MVSVAQRITWHNAMLDGPVWAIRRGYWQEATIIGRGRKTARVRFLDTGNCATRAYSELAGRCPAKAGNDRPANSKH